jgi:hypothetical protein
MYRIKSGDLWKYARGFYNGEDDSKLYHDLKKLQSLVKRHTTYHEQQVNREIIRESKNPNSTGAYTSWWQTRLDQWKNCEIVEYELTRTK